MVKAILEQVCESRQLGGFWSFNIKKTAKYFFAKSDCLWKICEKRILFFFKFHDFEEKITTSFSKLKNYLQIFYQTTTSFKTLETAILFLLLWATDLEFGWFDNDLTRDMRIENYVLIPSRKEKQNIGPDVIKAATLLIAPFHIHLMSIVYQGPRFCNGSSRVQVFILSIMMDVQQKLN